MMELLTDPTYLTVIIGVTVLGAVCGTLGTLAVLRRSALVGDTLAHAALPGIAGAALLTGTTALPVLLVGAAVTGLLALTLSDIARRMARVESSAALGTSLSVFFGIGVVLLGVVQQQQGGTAGLERFLFGQAAALLPAHILLTAGVGAAAILVLWRADFAIRTATFDRTFAETVGLTTSRIDLLVTGLLAAGVVVGLSTVGVVLVSALLVAPPVAALQYTRKYGHTYLLAALFGGLIGAVGSAASLLIPGAPTGPIVVLLAVAWVAISLGIRSVLTRTQGRQPA